MNCFNNITLVTSLSIVNCTINRLVSPSLNILNHEDFWNFVVPKMCHPIFLRSESIFMISYHKTTNTNFDFTSYRLDNLFQNKIVHEILEFNFWVRPSWNGIFNDKIVWILFVNYLCASYFVILSICCKFIKLHFF